MCLAMDITIGFFDSRIACSNGLKDETAMLWRKLKSFFLQSSPPSAFSSIFPPNLPIVEQLPNGLDALRGGECGHDLRGEAGVDDHAEEEADDEEDLASGVPGHEGAPAVAHHAGEPLHRVAEGRVDGRAEEGGVLVQLLLPLLLLARGESPHAQGDEVEGQQQGQAEENEECPSINGDSKFGSGKW